MTEFEDYKKLLVGKTLTNLYFTKQDGPHDYMPGISPAYYFSTILEIDNDQKLLFGNDFIIDWKEEVPIIELTNQNWDIHPAIVFKGQEIVDLTQDEQEQLTFHLANGTTLAHTIDYGDQLFIKNERIDSAKEQESVWPITAPKQELPKVRKTWWRRLFGLK